MPHQFKDAKGHVYTLTLTLGKARAIAGQTAMDVFNQDDWVRLMSSLGEQLAYAWLLVVDQAGDYGVDLDAFEANLQGDGIATGAATALFKELADFYRKYDQPAKAIATEKAAQLEQSRRNIDLKAFDGALDNLLAKLTAGSPAATPG